jgi:aminoglycoside phosphotransferase (APT) family kinase protein
MEQARFTIWAGLKYIGSCRSKIMTKGAIMNSAEEIGEIREAHRFDEKALADYLKNKLEGFGGALTVHQFTYGQSNPTFVLSAAGQEYVLRKKPPGKLLPSAHMVDREYRILRALENTGVPVPKTYLLCNDDAVIGTPFYIMEKMNGRIFRSPTAPEASSAAERAAIFDSMNDTMARIHNVDWKALGLEDFGKPGNYMARQIGRWTKQYEMSKTEDIESMDKLIQWLNDNIPADDSTSVVHGDFRLENTMVHATEPRIIAVFDWELSTLGHPLADLAYNCMGYHLPDMEEKKMSYTSVNLKKWGIPTEAEYIDAYCRRTGRKDIPDWEFYIAFSIFRLAAIVQGVYKRGLDGIASSATAKTYGAVVRFLADSGWQIVSQ